MSMLPTEVMAGQRLMACVGLVKALGGGWDQSLPVTVPPVEVDEAAVETPGKRPGFFGKIKGLFKKDDGAAAAK